MPLKSFKQKPLGDIKPLKQQQKNTVGKHEGDKVKDAPVLPHEANLHSKVSVSDDFVTSKQHNFVCKQKQSLLIHRNLILKQRNAILTSFLSEESSYSWFDEGFDHVRNKL